MYLLDTVVLSELRKPERNAGVTTWLNGKKDNELFLSALTSAKFGVASSQHGKKEPFSLRQDYPNGLIPFCSCMGNAFCPFPRK